MLECRVYNINRVGVAQVQQLLHNGMALHITLTHMMLASPSLHSTAGIT